MLTYIATRCTECLKRRQLIKEEEGAVFIYGFELILSFMFCLIAAGTLSLIFGYWDRLILFLATFIPLRMAAGGYHARSYRGCFVLSNIVLFTGVLLSSWMDRMYGAGLGMTLSALGIASLYIWKQAPVVAGPPMKEPVRIRNRRYARFMTGLFGSICMDTRFTHLLPVPVSMGSSAAVAVLMVAVFMSVASDRNQAAQSAGS